MRFAPTEIDPEMLASMSDAELDEFLETVERLRREQQRRHLQLFARAVEVPGVPSPLVNDSVLQDEFRRARTGKVHDEPADETPDEPELYPDLLEPAAHHDLIMETVQGMLEGTLVTSKGEPVDGVMTLAPPGSAKSTYTSMIAPAWAMGRWANFNVIGISYAQELADRFSRRARAICLSPDYAQISEAQVVAGNMGIHNWSLTNGSEYRSAGVLAGITGFRADLLSIDDPIKGREDADSDIIRDKVFKAFEDDIWTRLKPGGKIMLTLTRWHEDDPAGRILGPEWKGQSGHWRGTDGRNWYIIRLPMLADRADDPLGRKEGERLWPEWFDAREVERLRLKGGRTWSALYQQTPSPGEGNIILRTYWRCWPHGHPEPTPSQVIDPHKTKPPRCEFILLSYDTAIEEGEENDYSALTAWGIFKGESTLPSVRQTNQYHAIMIGAWRDRLDLPALMEIIEHHVARFRPDLIVVEKRASGHQVIQELRRKRWPVKAWLPPGIKGAKGKVPRAHAAAYVMEQGTVWYMPGPATTQVREECAAFPNATYKDWTDTVTQALIFFRDRFLLQVPSDDLDLDEKAEQAEREFLAKRSQRRLYGQRRSDEDDIGPPITAGTRKRRLYG